ncbi:MAG: DUF5665 domain-containing protein [Clostridia bacterium]
MIEELIDRLEQVLGRMERMHLEDYLCYISDKKRYAWFVFWTGVLRGLGTAVGFTVLGAALVVILQQVVNHNIPLIGNFLAEVVRVVEKKV